MELMGWRDRIALVMLTLMGAALVLPPLMQDFLDLLWWIRRMGGDLL